MPSAAPAPRLDAPDGAPAAPAGPTLIAQAPRRAPATLDAVAASLAGLDGVNGVARFDAGGRPLEFRGALSDAAALGRTVVAGAALLETGEPLRSIAVDTARGRLVAVAVRPYWLALTGTAELNLGAVYAALAALGEER